MDSNISYIKPRCLNLDQIKLIGEDKGALFVLDQNFSKKAD